MAATLPLPDEASAFSAVIAEKVRFRLVIEIDTDTGELELVGLDVELVVLLLLLLLQAAAARHRASDTATTSPFLATRIIETTSRHKGNGRTQACGLAADLEIITALRL